MKGVSTSVLSSALREDVCERIGAFSELEGGEMGLVLWSAAAQAVDFDATLEGEELASDHAVSPSRFDIEAAAEQLDSTIGIAATQEDDPGHPAWLPFGQGMPGWCGIASICGFSAMGLDVASADAPQGRQLDRRAMASDGPLEPFVEGLDEVLRGVFARDGKDRHHAPAEAKARDGAEAVGVVVGPVEAHVVVELREGRGTVLSPALVQSGAGECGGDQRRGPDVCQRPSKGEGAEDLEPLGPDLLDDVEAVQFGAACGHLGQVPSRRRWRKPAAAEALGQTAAREDSTDGRRGWQLPGRSGTVAQGAVDGVLAAFAQRTMEGQVPPQRHDSADHQLGGGIGRTGRASGPILEADAIQPPVPGPAQPVLDGAEPQPHLLGDRTPGAAGSHQLHDPPPGAGREAFFMTGRLAPSGAVGGPSSAAARSARLRSGGTPTARLPLRSPLDPIPFLMMTDLMNLSLGVT